MNKVERIVVGMSGGVDSSVAALMLKQQGFDVIGVFMKNWDEKDENGACTSTQDWNDVQDVCDIIGIPCYSVNFEKEYQERVFTYFLDEYRKGRTPNPDVLCNREIKFKAFLDYALKLGADRIATGHFVKNGMVDGEMRLLRGDDGQKDQSYFLYMLKEWQVKRALFPVGHMTKAEIRAFAEENNLPTFKKKDSTGVCFIGERNFRKFLSEFLPLQPGDMRTEEGEKVGAHIGLAYYTLGQRRGLGIGGRGDGRSWFVVDKDLANNILIVAQGDDSPRLYSKFIKADQATWISDEAPCKDGESFECTAKFRYRQTDQPVRVTLQGETLLIESQELQRAVTPGQSVVLYHGDICLGGGIAETAKMEVFV
ncbi:MAG: tRNA 2-thiouridine(34) synthase MnmA [Clostridiales bacterium]|nr:tRNA 2-thiouridine(34) synthase MnmA [Clostridiales bacterium]